MNPEIVIDPETGAVSFAGLPVVLHAGVPRETVAKALSSFFRSNQDHENGYEWLDFSGLSFGGRPAAISVCFRTSCLSEIAWGVSLGDGLDEPSFPTREECDAEIAFVRARLCVVFARSFSSGCEQFPWGEIWSCFDERSGCASSGLRYEVKPPVPESSSRSLSARWRSLFRSVFRFR